jgi:hypothetical protein
VAPAVPAPDRPNVLDVVAGSLADTPTGALLPGPDPARVLDAETARLAAAPPVPPAAAGPALPDPRPTAPNPLDLAAQRPVPAAPLPAAVAPSAAPHGATTRAVPHGGRAGAGWSFVVVPEASIERILERVAQLPRESPRDIAARGGARRDPDEQLDALESGVRDAAALVPAAVGVPGGDPAPRPDPVGPPAAAAGARPVDGRDRTGTGR